MKSQEGFVLLLVLLFVFVLTLFAIGDTQEAILETKMQNNTQDYALVFARAESGLQQAVLSLEGVSFSLPNSSIALHVSTNIVSTDDCGNRVIDIQSTANDTIARVVLNSRHIFAKVPREKGCHAIPLHQVLWWKT